jgi:hypothetical protein
MLHNIFYDVAIVSLGCCIFSNAKYRMQHDTDVYVAAGFSDGQRITN